MLVFKSRFSVILASLLCFMCHRAPKEATHQERIVNIDLETILKRGYITALVDNNSVSYFIYKGHPMGYEYELLNLFAKHLNVSLKIKVISGVEKGIDHLNNGDADILAFPMIVTKERKKQIAFTRPHFNSYQVLVQRKPSNWRKLRIDQINDSLLRNPSELIGKDIHVLKNSAYKERLAHLSEEIGGDINIIEDSVDAESESLIQKVANGEIDYTVANHAMASVNAAYYPHLDVNTILSLPQQISWALRKTSPQLLRALNAWLSVIKKEPTFMVIYNRYYKSPRTSIMRIKSDYSSLGGNKLSPYDHLIKEGAKTLGWDWRLLASVVYQESKFKINDESWAGARGIMQLMPATAKRFGVNDLDDPVQNIRAGVRYLAYLDRYWSRTVFDHNERLKFILASYNAGPGHVIDAQKLAKKFGKDPTQWSDNVEEFLLKKSDPTYFRDAIVQSGQCKCTEPISYVRDILVRYEQYKIHIEG